MSSVERSKWFSWGTYTSVNVELNILFESYLFGLQTGDPNRGTSSIPFFLTDYT